MADPPVFAKVSHAFTGFVQCYAFDVSMNDCPIDFLNPKKDALSGLLSSKNDEFKNINVIASLHIKCAKHFTGVTTQPYMNSRIHVLFNEHEVDEAVHDIIDEPQSPDCRHRHMTLSSRTFRVEGQVSGERAYLPGIRLFFPRPQKCRLDYFPRHIDLGCASGNMLARKIIAGIFSASGNEVYIRNPLDVTGKTIFTEELFLSKDNQQRFYLGENRGMSVRDEMDNFFENNKAFAIFQVGEVNDSTVTNLSLTPVYIGFGYQFAGLDGDALYFYIANFSSTVGKHVAPPGVNTHVSFDNAAAAPKLTLALGKSVSHIQQIAGQKYVLSLSRNSRVFAIYLNSVLFFWHTDLDNRPFHHINGNEDAEYRVGGTHFANETTLKLLSLTFCQRPFWRHD